MNTTAPDTSSTRHLKHKFLSFNNFFLMGQCHEIFFTTHTGPRAEATPTFGHLNEIKKREQKIKGTDPFFRHCYVVKLYFSFPE
jgi:hypothetical protein